MNRDGPRERVVLSRKVMIMEFPTLEPLRFNGQKILPPKPVELDLEKDGTEIDRLVALGVIKDVRTQSEGDAQDTGNSGSKDQTAAPARPKTKAPANKAPAKAQTKKTPAKKAAPKKTPAKAPADVAEKPVTDPGAHPAEPAKE